jgi:hypothetical protein
MVFSWWFNLGSYVVELSWLMKLRIAASAACGVVVIGLLAWPLAAPPEPFGAVSVFAGTINLTGTIILAVLALVAGFAAYFMSWPYGREIGILAVPSGLAVWAVRCGNMATLAQLNPTVAQRQALFASLKWEPLLWLGIVGAGFAGALAGQMVSAKGGAERNQEKSSFESRVYLNAIIALVASVLIAYVGVRVFARNVAALDEQIGSVAAQPATGQIVFAVLVSFGFAAFVVKKFLNASYTWPIIASGLVSGFVMIFYVKQEALQHLVGHYPAAFFPNAVTCILPVQMVAFGTLGAIAGYWTAVRYNYWRKHGI